MDSIVSIDNYLIACLMILSKSERDPGVVNVGKTHDKQLVDTLKAKYKLKKKDRGFDIDSINDEATAFAMQLLASKIMRKGRHNQVVTHFIELGSQCAQSVQYNWAIYLQNQFFDDYGEA